MKLSRRNLLLGAALLSAETSGSMPQRVFFSGLDRLRAEPWDLIIVGAGIAGLMTAIRSSMNGLRRVLILEKTPFTGGAALLSEGVFAFSETPYQAARGIRDKDEIFYEDMRRTGNYRNDPELLKAYLKFSHPVYEWLSANGINPVAVDTGSGISMPRAHTYRVVPLMEKLRSEAVKSGAVIASNTQAVTLETEGGRVSGVVVRRGERTATLRAKYGVVLASGGFLRRPDWVRRYRPTMSNAVRVCAAGADGDGISMALPLHAGLRDMRFLHVSYGFSLFPATVGDFTHVGYRGAMIVNQQGLRFVNESLPYTDIGRIALEKEHNQSYFVFDEEIRQRQMKAREVDAKLLANPVRADGQVIFYSGDSINEVAAKAGLNPSNLSWTVTRYNRFVETGHDADFRRDSLTFGYGRPSRIIKPPFYVFPTLAGMMGSYCGLAINQEGAVLTAGGRVIPGLYAAGEVTGGFHGEAFIGGTALGKAIIFGWIVGNTVGRLHA